LQPMWNCLLTPKADWAQILAHCTSTGQVTSLFEFRRTKCESLKSSVLMILRFDDGQAVYRGVNLS